MSEISDCKRRLRKSAERSLRKGFGGDWTDTMFKVHVLELLEKIAKSKKRQPTEYQIKLGKLMKEGKSIQEAHRLAKESK